MANCEFTVYFGRFYGGNRLCSRQATGQVEGSNYCTLHQKIALRNLAARPLPLSDAYKRQLKSAVRARKNEDMGRDSKEEED